MVVPESEGARRVQRVGFHCNKPGSLRGVPQASCGASCSAPHGVSKAQIASGQHGSDQTKNSAIISNVQQVRARPQLHDIPTSPK